MQKDISRTVQHPDGMWVKTIPVSAGTGPYTLVSPSRRQEGEKTVAGMTRVKNDPLGLPPAALAVKVLDGWQCSPCNTLCMSLSVCAVCEEVVMCNSV